MRKRHVVVLSEQERARLHTMIAAGVAPARTQTHARLLLKADQGPAGPGWTDAAIATALEVGECTVARVRARWVDHGLEDALHRRGARGANTGARLDGQRPRRI